MKNKINLLWSNRSDFDANRRNDRTLSRLKCSKSCKNWRIGKKIMILTPLRVETTKNRATSYPSAIKTAVKNFFSLQTKMMTATRCSPLSKRKRASAPSTRSASSWPTVSPHKHSGTTVSEHSESWGDSLRFRCDGSCCAAPGPRWGPRPFCVCLCGASVWCLGVAAGCHRVGCVVGSDHRPPSPPGMSGYRCASAVAALLGDAYAVSPGCLPERTRELEGKGPFRVRPLLRSPRCPPCRLRRRRVVPVWCPCEPAL